MASARKRNPAATILSVLFLLTGLAAAAAGTLLILGRQPEESRIEMMEQRLRNMRQLRTVTRTYRSVIFVEERNFWKGRKEVLFTLEYDVTAGVDFSRGLEIEELSGDGWRVSMPAAEVFESDADESSIRQMILREQSFFNPINMGDYMPHIIAQGEANRQAAIDDGILDKAEINARNAVLKVLGLGGIRDVVFATLDAGGTE